MVWISAQVKAKIFMSANTFEKSQMWLTRFKTTDPAGSAAVQHGRAERFEYASLLKTMDFPVLIIVGDQDKFTPLESADICMIKSNILGWK